MIFTTFTYLGIMLAFTIPALLDTISMLNFATLEEIEVAGMLRPQVVDVQDKGD